jgi:aryl-alcohol dehydrogenase-like predicted oxidoreductase
LRVPQLACYTSTRGVELSTGNEPRGATPSGTAAYRDAYSERTAPGHFRTTGGGIVMSSIGLGTYLGDEDDVTDALYDEAVAAAVAQGCNVFDAAINYRCQRSERVIGRTVSRLIDQGTVQRDQIVLATKGGFLPFDGQVPPDPRGYHKATYMDNDLIRANELVAHCHSIAPAFLEDQIRRSLANLRTGCIDIYYLHNPETQLQEVSRDDFLDRMRSAFALLEEHADAGVIGAYGLATWNGFRRSKRAREYLSLAELVRIAEDLRGADHRFRFVQLPYNLAMVEARTVQAQLVEGRRRSLLEAAQAFGLTVVASASILQGQLTRLPADLAAALPGFTSDVQRAIQFVRSTPGVTTALVGMKGHRHVEENLDVGRLPPDPEAAEGLIAAHAA